MPEVRETLAERIGVAERTLSDHLRYGRRLGRSAARLLSLIRRGRIMPENAAWAGFRFDHEDRLVCDNGETVYPGEVATLTWLRRSLQHATQDVRRAEAEIERLEAELRDRSGAANDGVHRTRL